MGRKLAISTIVANLQRALAGDDSALRLQKLVERILVREDSRYLRTSRIYASALDLSTHRLQHH